MSKARKTPVSKTFTKVTPENAVEVMNELEQAIAELQEEAADNDEQAEINAFEDLIPHSPSNPLISL